jgi:hypothetical protein
MRPFLLSFPTRTYNSGSLSHLIPLPFILRRCCRSYRNRRGCTLLRTEHY